MTVTGALPAQGTYYVSRVCLCDAVKPDPSFGISQVEGAQQFTPVQDPEEGENRLIGVEHRDVARQKFRLAAAPGQKAPGAVKRGCGIRFLPFDGAGPVVVRDRQPGGDL